MEVEVVGNEGTKNISVGVQELVQEYERRLARYQEQMLSKDDDEEV